MIIEHRRSSAPTIAGDCTRRIIRAGGSIRGFLRCFLAPRCCLVPRCRLGGGERPLAHQDAPTIDLQALRAEVALRRRLVGILLR